MDAVQAEPLDTFEHRTLSKQPTIKRDSNDFAIRSVEDWSGEKSLWSAEGPSDSNSRNPNTLEKPSGSKGVSAAKGMETDKNPKAIDRGRPTDDASWKEALALDTPAWPIGNRLTASSTSTLTKPLRKEDDRTGKDTPKAPSPKVSPIKRNSTGKGKKKSKSDHRQDQPVADKGKPRKPEKPIQPAKDVQQLPSDEDLKRHQIVDGDTLPKLAVAYLGDRDRYLDIFDANRDVLSDPRLLPIGAELAIPAGKKHDSNQPIQRTAVRSSENTGTADDGELVPIPTFALPPRIRR